MNPIWLRIALRSLVYDTRRDDIEIPIVLLSLQHDFQRQIHVAGFSTPLN